jgi:hypothetical protein
MLRMLLAHAMLRGSEQGSTWIILMAHYHTGKGAPRRHPYQDSRSASLTHLLAVDVRVIQFLAPAPIVLLPPLSSTFSLYRNLRHN